MSKRLRTGLTVFILIAMVFSAGQLFANGQAEQEKGTVKLAYGNWAETIAFTHMMELILEEMGYTVEKTMAEVALQYSSVASGSHDIMVETWMPVTQKSYWEKFSDDFDILGLWFDQAKIGLVVPDYMSINSIAELNDIKDELGGEIVGIDAGAGIMKNTAKAIEAYDLDLELLTSSGPAMTTALKSAIDAGEPVVVTGWAPHWKFARYDLRFLEDPKKVYGGKELVRSICRKGFKEDMPEVAALFENVKFTMGQIGSLMDVVSNSGLSEDDAAAQWIEENRELVDSWIPQN